MPIETLPNERYDLPRIVATARPERTKLEDLLANVGGNRRVVLVLHVAAVDAESGQAFLVVSGQHGGEINGAGPLGSVESPNGLGRQRIHVHRFGAVAPAGRDGQRHADAFAGELLGGAGGFGHAADARVGDHAFDRGAAGVADRFGDQLGDALGHPHRLAFERFANAPAPAVNCGPDANLGKRSNKTIDRRNVCGP